MKLWIICVFILLGGLTGFAQSEPEDEYKALSSQDQELLSKAVELADQGMTEAIMPDFDLLAQKYPDNYLVQYERAYNLYMLGRYDEVIKCHKFLLNNKFTTDRAYQLIGNSYDNNGDSKKAVKVYKNGLKRFPHSSSLYLELGAVSLSKNDYNKALEYYNLGILVQPEFASNYYWASQLYLSSYSGKVWGLVYAESAVLLAPSNEERHSVMAAAIADCLKASIKMSFDDEARISVNLVPDRDMRIDDKSNKVYLGFPGIYEGALGQPLSKLFVEKVPFTGSLPQLIEVRRGLVENYFSVTDDLYGNSMYLLEFQKKIIDAGHWEAYNYFLFEPCFPEAFEAWYSVNRVLFEAFVKWYNNAPYSLGDGRTVDPMQIFDNYRPIDLPQALRIQAELLKDVMNITSEKPDEE